MPRIQGQGRPHVAVTSATGGGRYIKTELTRARAFTMLELLVVIAVIGILVSALVVAGSSMIENAKAKKTEFMIRIVQDAIEQFSQEQSEKPTIARPAAYRSRYDHFPPDELEVFTRDGIPYGTISDQRTRAPGGAVVVPGPSTGINYGNMLFQIDRLVPEEAAVEHRDLAAMVLAITLYSEAAETMLDKISSSHWIVPEDVDGNPLQFLDRADLDGTAPNGRFDAGLDLEIRYLVDDWGVPLTYFAQRDWGTTCDAGDCDSSNHAAWNEVSTGMIRLNGGQPILCSYGANGREQLAKEVIDVLDKPSTLVADWMDPADLANDGKPRINSPLNEDNIYADPSLKERLHRGSR